MYPVKTGLIIEGRRRLIHEMSNKVSLQPLRDKILLSKAKLNILNNINQESNHLVSYELCM